MYLGCVFTPMCCRCEGLSRGTLETLVRGRLCLALLGEAFLRLWHHPGTIRHLEGLLKLIRGPALSFCFSRSGVGLENLHF